MSDLVAEDGVIAYRFAKLPGVHAQEGVGGKPSAALSGFGEVSRAGRGPPRSRAKSVTR